MSAATNLIVASPEFEAHWPFVVDDLAQILERHGSAPGATRVVRTQPGQHRRLGELIGAPAAVTRLICLDVPVTRQCLAQFSALREAAFLRAYGGSYLDAPQQAELRGRGVAIYAQTSEGFWGQSVAEFALGLTICGLRRIPQNHHALHVGDPSAWTHYAPEHNQGPGTRGAQFSDDIYFTNGSIAGKRVRIVGAGNIGSRYAHFVHTLGAHVAMWDPVAADPAFHRSGARREWRLPRLVEDAEIFAPMMPLLDATREIVGAELIHNLPRGCLVVLATRAGIVHMTTLRERVLRGELALAADVFDVEPLAADDPLLGRSNVVHTPHLAGRTRDANRQWAADLVGQFSFTHEISELSS